MGNYLENLYEMIDEYNKDDCIKAEDFGIIKPDGSVYTIKLPVYQGEKKKLESDCKEILNCSLVSVFTDSESENWKETVCGQLRLWFCNINVDSIDKLVYLKDGKWNSLGSLVKKCDMIGKYIKVIHETHVYQ
jgi:hypothetical protein